MRFFSVLGSFFPMLLLAAGKLWKRLTLPISVSHDPNRQRQMRWLSVFILLLFPFTVLGVYYTGPGPFYEWSVSYNLLVVAVILIAVYLLNRSGRYSLAITILMVTLSSLPYSAWLSKNDFGHASFHTSFIWVLLPIVLAGLFLSFRGIVLLVLGNNIAILLLPLIRPQLALTDVWDLMGIVFILSVIIIAENVLYQQNTRKIEEQSQQILENEAQLHQLLQSNPAVVYSSQASGDFPATFISSNITEQLGYEAEQFLEDPGFWANHIHPEDAPRVFEELPSLFENGNHVHEYRFKHRDGSYRWMRDSLKLIKKPDGSPDKIVGTWIDISERVELEAALKSSEETFRSIVETNSLAILILDDARKIQFGNQAAKNMLFAGKQDIQGEKLSFAPKLDEVMELSIPATNGDGLAIVRVLASETKWQEREAILVLIEDITEKAAIGEALRQSEERYRGLSEAAQDVIFVINRHWEVEYANPVATNMFGIGHGGNILGKLIGELFSTDDAEGMMKSIQSVFDTGNSHSSFRAISFNGNDIWLDTNLVAMRNSAGDVASVMGISRNVTERKKIEEQNIRFGRVLEQSSNEIYIFDPETLIFAEVNAGARDNLGYSIEKLKHMTPLDFLPEFTSQSFADLLAPLKSGEEANLRFETIHKRKDGSSYPVEVNLQLIQVEKSPVFAAIISDITERRQAENRIRSANRALVSLSESNRAVIYARSENELLDNICKILVERGGYRMAWIGYAQSDEKKSVLPMAQSGYEDGYLDDLKLTWDDSERGRGPAGVAIRSGKTMVTEDILNDPSFTPWRENALSKGYASSIAIPILFDSQVFAILNVYASEAFAFDERETVFLEDLASNLSFGISALRTNRERQQSNSFIQAFNIIAARVNSAASPESVVQTLGEELSPLNLTVSLALVNQHNNKLHLEHVSIGHKLISLAEKLSGLRMKNYEFPVALYPNYEVLLSDRKATFSEKRHEEIRGVFKDIPTPVFDRVLQIIGITKGVKAIDAPMISNSNLIGFLTLWGSEIREADLPAVAGLANQVATAYEKASILTELSNSKDEIERSYIRTLEGWSAALDLRDEETEGHSQRVTEMTVRLAKALGLGEDELTPIRRGALLHDIGKMGIPDSILKKPGTLSEEEWATMRKHPVFAYEWLSPIEYLSDALEIPYAHHEKWDGSGYPRGLKAEEIPLAARIFAIVDVWDALRSDRPYRKAWSKKNTLEYLREQKGKHFDPDIAGVFLENNLGD